MEELKLALKQAGLLEVFDGLPPSHQREYVKWIEEAKKPETRANRLAKAVAMIRDKHSL